MASRARGAVRLAPVGILALVLVPGLLAGAGRARAQNQPSFTGIGDLPGGAFDSVAEGVSHDGVVVVGGSESSAGPQAIRWTAAGGLVGLGDLPGGAFQSHATGVSANGAVISGTGVDADGESRAFRWTAGSGLVALGQFGCFLCPAHAFGNGVSANGLVVVGSGARQVFAEGVSVDAARWTGGGTSISGLGHLPGPARASQAQAASSTGAVIVGSSDGSAGVQAFRWTSGGMVALPGVPGAAVGSGATDVSDDGNVVVGYANTHPSHTAQREAVRWVAPGFAAQLLGSLPGAPSPGSRAWGVSPDGSVIVGSANDAQGRDAAFVWDAVHGMRPLAAVLEEEYGLDLGGWHLVDARDVSAANAAGEVVIVGSGINPDGQREGWVAVLSPTACNDGDDDDGDGLVDYPDDPGCTAPGDRSEGPDCADGLDNDGDGLVDFPADPGCASAADQTERFDCADGVDNDGDGAADFPADAGCRQPTSPVEDPTCQNGLDDDRDGLVDFPDDPGCVAPDDLSEVFDCDDGLDNDGDGLVDHPADPDCTGKLDGSEDLQCSDRIDNDRDGVRDWPEAYPACTSAADPIEKAPCSDGLDDDGDGLVDHPADPGCAKAGFGSEDPGSVAIGDLLVLDRRSRTLLRLDVASGAQRPLSVSAQLTDPQGLAVRPGGAIVVADPVGLLEVWPSTGRQRRFSPPLSAASSLQLVFDAAGDVVVLESGGLGVVPFVWGGEAAPTPLLTLPVPGSIATFQGDALAREASGHLLVTGFGLLGDGVHRISPDGSTVTKVTAGFTGDVWSDLAVEASGSILAVGTRFGVGPGVYRIDAATGSVAALSAGAPWVAPSAVAVAPGGAVYVADAGTCTASGCTGAEVVELDPASGARLASASGGALTGEMDLAVVTALPACANGLDDDGDGAADFPADADCDAFEDASELPDCANGLDDDGDGAIDHPADPGCFDATSFSSESPACSNGWDDDGDGAVDHAGGPNGEPADAQCQGRPFRDNERPDPGCGLGAEAALLLPLLAAWRARRRA